MITPIDLDHQQFLGETLAEIAGEKAGILKRGVPCVVARQQDAALEVIERQAARKGWTRRFLCKGSTGRSERNAGGWCFRTKPGLLDLPMPVLSGPHQVENAGNGADGAARALGAGSRLRRR